MIPIMVSQSGIGDQDKTKENSVAILLNSLLRKVEYPQKRLELIKQVVQQLMNLDYAAPIVEKEPCYAEKALFEKLAEDPIASPIKDLVSCLIESINLYSEQGRVAVGKRLLLEICPFAVKKPIHIFTKGIDFIRDVIMEINKFYNEHKGWPDEQTVNSLIEASFQAANNSSEEKGPSSNSEEAHRFRAMAGSAIFANLNAGLSFGGYAKDAAHWYLETLFIAFDSLQQIGMLDDYWDKTALQRLLEEVSEYQPNVAKRISALNDKNSRFIGFRIDMPRHFILSLLYKRGEEWIYLVMCRAFLQTFSQQNYQGAVEFIIPEEHIAKLEPILANATKEKRFIKTSDASGCREIKYRLLNHFLAIEKLTGVAATYSSIASQSSYKGPTCFASNIKLLLPILLRSMIKPTATLQQWKEFNDDLTNRILAEMIKAHVATDEFKEEMQALPKQNSQPEQIAYKLITTLIRWREINQFKPVTDSEVAGKEATIAHVLTHTKQRFMLANGFFKSMSELEEGSYQGKLQSEVKR
ncbi:hypothetical protein [Legionella gresilensis]|uniref:hypothetical protein n=1 Tax=Legionella gresilensis TaxID=91823 RepID=UPI00104125BA|nr:hypothetical protein [Legionella gresilensis]